jgi:predicted nucleic acid-binding Zn ribbon protein
LSVLYGEAQAAAGAVRAAAGAWFDAPDPRKLALVSAARVAVYEAADKAITIAQQAVGVQAMFVGHPLSVTLTDLTVYIRQPGPDAQRMRVGAAVADGTLGVDL